MFLKNLIFVLVLVINQSCSKTAESSGFDFDFPDLTASYETDHKQFHIEAYKSSFNDKLIEKNQTGFHKQLKWVSLGNPMLIKTTQNNISRLFHDSSDGFYTFIQILSNHEREILVKRVKDSYGFDIDKDQIVILPLITFKCKIVKSYQNAFNDVLIGKVNNFNQNPLRIDFMAPKDSQERLKFEKILLNNEENDSNLDCTVKAKAKTKTTNEIIKNPQEIESHRIQEKLLGGANEVYLTPNHLVKLASEFYSSLNIIEDYEMEEFSNLFVKEIVQKFTKSGLTHVPFDEAISLLPKYTDDLKSIFEQIIAIKRNEENDEYLALNTQKLEELESLIDIEDFNLQMTVSFLNSNKRGLIKSVSEQLNDLNKETINEIQWKREGAKMLPNTLFVAKFEESLFSKAIKFNKITIIEKTIIERIIIESEFEKNFRLNSKSDIGQNNFKSDAANFNEEIKKHQISLNQAKSKYGLILNEKNLEIENCKINLNETKYEKTEIKIKYDQFFNKIYSENIKKFETSKTLTGHTNEVWSLVVLQDGSLASGSVDSTIRIWNVKSGLTTKTLTGHTGCVRSLALLPDGSLASGSGDNTIRIWNVTSGLTTKTLTGHTGYVRSLALLPDGSLASGSFDKTIRIWNVTSGLTIRTLTGHTNVVFTLAVLPDSSLASGSQDATIRIWNVTSGLTIKTLTGHNSYVYSLAVLPDGALASGSNDNTIRIWNVTSGLTIKTLIGHTNEVYSMAVLPDGSLASGSNDSTIRIWNVTSSLTIKTLTGHTGYVFPLAVLPDGSLASGSKDTTLRIWNKN